MPPIKFWLNQPYRLGEDVVWRISRWLLSWSSWISEQNHFSNSKSLCHCDASHQVLAQSDLRFGRRCSHLGYWKGTILAILNLCVTVMPPIKFWLNPTYGLGRNVVWKISRWLPWWPSWISEWKDFSNSESLCHCDASHQVSAHSDLWFGRSRLKNFKMVAMAAILESERNDYSNSESPCSHNASH